MWQADPNTGRFDSARFRACLIQSVDALLKNDVSIYFVKDDGWGMNDIMIEYYTMHPILPEAGVVSVNPPVHTTDRVDLINCNWIK